MERRIVPAMAEVIEGEFVLTKWLVLFKGMLLHVSA